MQYDLVIGERDMRIFRHFMREDSGATAVEYALFAGLIALVVVASVTAVGAGLQGKFNAVASNLS
jgi:pilus assembly protein Flp/PilA